MAESAKRHDENSNLIKEIRAATDAATRNQGASIKAFGNSNWENEQIVKKRRHCRVYLWIPREWYKQIKALINVHDLAILEDALPQKEKDLGSFTIPCYINNICFKKALDDLGASISVMPYSTSTDLGLGKLTPTKLIIELANRTIKRPKGIVENVSVGRPFLSTACTKIDLFKRKITLRVGDDKIVFKNNNPTNSIIRRVYALGLKERMELDLEARLMGEALILNRSLDLTYGDY
ncbi:zinc finger, CCHC-type containing protein [Tanacetum coccineum]